MKIIIGLLSLSCMCLMGAGTNTVANISVTPGKHNSYYHLKFALTPQNTELTVPVTEYKSKYPGSNAHGPDAGGQFEIFVSRSAFPIPSPHTERAYLILRMPATDGKETNAAVCIAEKRSLFDAVKKMKETGKGSVDVCIELNPYVKALSKQPLQLELTQRNIYFRHAHGRYIDYTGALK